MKFIRFFQRNHKFLVLFFDFSLLSFSFLVLAWIKPATISYVLPTYIEPFLTFSLIWIGISLVMGKYDLSIYKKPVHLFISITITGFIVISIISILLFALKISQYSRLIIFGTVTLCYFLEVIFFRILYAWIHPKEISHKGNGKYHPVLIDHEVDSIIEKDIPQTEGFQNKNRVKSREDLITDEAGPTVYDYFSEHININDEGVILTATTTPFNINNIARENLAAIVNLKKVNDMRYINKFFEAINLKLRDAGMYIGCVETSQQRYRRIESKFPPFIRKFVIVLDFILNRIFPRISFLKSIYFNITSGVKRTISKAEVLGRLVSCGFEIIEYKEINNLTYFVVMKTGEPEYNLAPSYGPLYKMPRIGKNGKIIYVYKFRTMHPFSEYLQDYVLRLNGYSAVGKPADDFRLTKWGKFMRKFWLDEAPQIINVLKGEMNLVGIRPLSKRAFSDYPDDVKQMRIKYKPGCIPPYVALLKQGMQESIEAERIYLLEKEKSPYLTDLRYFGLAIFNIVTNKIRSA
jgi:hypothetical protein